MLDFGFWIGRTPNPCAPAAQPLKCHSLAWTPAQPTRIGPLVPLSPVDESRTQIIAPGWRGPPREQVYYSARILLRASCFPQGSPVEDSTDEGSKRRAPNGS